MIRRKTEPINPLYLRAYNILNNAVSRVVFIIISGWFENMCEYYERGYERTVITIFTKKESGKKKINVWLCELQYLFLVVVICQLHIIQ